MGMIFMALGGICYLLAFVCAIMVLIGAFKESVVQGILCLVCGLYALYFGIAKFQHEKKAMILGGWLGGGILGVILMNVAAMMMQPSH